MWKKRRTIFSKLISINAVSMIVSLIVIGILLYLSVSQYMINKMTAEMEIDARYLAEESLLCVDSNYDICNESFSKLLSIASNNSDSIITIVDNYGKIISASNQYDSSLRGSYIEKELIKEVTIGKPFKNFIKSTVLNENMMVVSAPITSNSNIYGAVLFYAPLPILNHVKIEILLIILSAFVLASIVALCLTYIFSKKFAEPLNEMNILVKTIANGRFDKRVTIKSNDELDELAENFNFMAENLENLEEMRSSFVANVSHELRTPMTTIGGFIDAIIDKTIPDDKVEDYLNIIRNEIKRLSRLVNDLLEVTRINALKEKPVFDKFDISELIRLTILKFEQKIIGKHIKIKIDIPDEKVIIYSNKDAMERVLTNLIDNAVKFCNNNGEIGIKLFESDYKIGITITNTGSFIKPEDIRYVWDRFYKGDKSRSKDKSGSGLGLYIVKNLVEACRGNIYVKSSKERTEFTFKISK